MKEKGKNLTAKQQRFCEEYLVDLNASAAARRAGYSKRTAHEIGFQNLQKPEIQEVLSELMRQRSERTEIEADAVLQEVAALGFSNITDVVYFEKNFLKVRDFSELPESVKKAIAEVSQKDGELKIKMHSKNGALDKLMKHLGLYEKDNSQSKPTVVTGFTFNIKTNEIEETE